MDTTIRLDGRALLNGLDWAASHTRQPILCILERDVVKISFMGGLRLAVSWQAFRSEGDYGDGSFVIPPEMTPELQRLPRMPLTLQISGQRASLGAGQSPLLRKSWSFDLKSLAAPPQFAKMIALPQGARQVDYVTLSDIVHKAIATLGDKDVNEAVPRNKLAILVNVQQGILEMDGVEISKGQPERFYFDPRLIVRSLDYLQGKVVDLGIQRLGFGNRAILHLVSTEHDHTVSCGLLSISLDTQRLFPLPPRTL